MMRITTRGDAGKIDGFVGFRACCASRDGVRWRMPVPPDAEPIRILGYALGSFSTPGAALASAFVLGILLGAIPVGAAELFVLVLAAVRPSSLIVPLLLVMTFGHVLGKLVWYWVGTHEHRLRHPFLRRQIEQSKRFMRSYPQLGVTALASSALLSIPPFHLTAIGAGIVRAPMLLFFAVAFAGRLVRFGIVGLLPQLVPELLR